MFETGRRSAISTSELGLYSDRDDRYNRSRYGIVIRKVVIGIMAVVAVVLAAIFIYDFASGASASSKVSQETKHIYILQNALKKPSGLPKRQLASTTLSPDVEINRTRNFRIQDRLDSEDSREITYVDDIEDSGIHHELRDPRNMSPETRSQSLENFKLRRKLIEEMDGKNENEDVEGKQSLNNHAIVYRVRQRYKYPDPSEELNVEESRPVPFHFELKTPQPASFNKRPKFPQLSQYRYPHTSRNIQEIIKYLANDPNVPNRGIKFAGVYINPKKYDLYPEVGELTSNSDGNGYPIDSNNEQSDDDDEEEFGDEEMSDGPRFSIGHNGDPFFMYKPKHPTDVNLLAPSNVRFSPSGTHRYNPYYDPFFQRPPVNYVKPIPIQEMQYGDNAGSPSGGNYGKKRKPKPFSVMLDIYPITDLGDQPNKKISRPRVPINIDYDPRRPLPHVRGQRFHPGVQTQPIPVVAVPAAQAGLTEEEERQQMIFHLNLYPRKKNKLNRNDIIHRSESMAPEEHKKFIHSVMSPFDAITKQLTDHSTIEESKYEEMDLTETNERPSNLNQQNYLEPPNENIGNANGYNEETGNADENNKEQSTESNNFPTSVNEEESEAPTSAELIKEEEAASTEKNLPDKIEECENCKDLKNKKTTNYSKDIDTPEGFQAFADGLIATD